jgi:hypothetical protein
MCLCVLVARVSSYMRFSVYRTDTNRIFFYDKVRHVKVWSSEAFTNFEEFTATLQVPGQGLFSYKFVRFPYVCGASSVWLQAADLYTMCRMDSYQGKATTWVHKRLAAWQGFQWKTKLEISTTMFLAVRGFQKPMIASSSQMLCGSECRENQNHESSIVSVSCVT